MPRILLGRVLVAASGAAISLAPLAPATATNLDIFASIDSQSQGPIMGDATYPGEEGSIALFAYAHEISIPIDPVTGQQTGAAQHGPIKLTKRHDSSTIPLLSAFLLHDQLASVEVRFYDGNAAPGLLLYTITAEAAFFSSRSESESTADLLTEELQLVYQQITWTWEGQTPLTTGDPQPEALRHALLLPSPNPTRADATFRFGLPAETQATLDVFDVSGRLVRGIFDGTANANEIVHWDGRDRGGRRVASGVYLVRLAWEGGTSTRRVTVLE